MILYNGIKYRGKVPFLLFINEKECQIEIPVDHNTAERVSKYLAKLSTTDFTSLNHQNDEPSD